MPLVFTDTGDEVQGGDGYASDIAAVQDLFIASIGGEGADPSTPEYKRKWLDAQRLADLQLRARIGAQAFAARQRAAHR